MEEQYFFSCQNCLHGKPSLDGKYMQCWNPEVEAIGFEGCGTESYTPEDWLKVDVLANKKIRIRTIVMKNEAIPNFEWPFKFDPIMISSCDSFEKRGYKLYDRGRRK